MIRGSVAQIRRRIAGSELSVAATPGAPALFVTSAADFDEDGGQLQLPNGTVLTYTSAFTGGGVEQINVTSPGAFPEESRIDVYPRLEEYYADVLQDDVEDVPIRARVPRQFLHYLSEGSYAEGELPTVLLEELETSFVVAQVLTLGDPDAPDHKVRGRSLGVAEDPTQRIVFHIEDDIGVSLFDVYASGDIAIPGDVTAALFQTIGAGAGSTPYAQLQFDGIYTNAGGVPATDYFKQRSTGRWGTASQIVADDGLTTIVVGHHVSDTDFVITPANGMLAIDTTGRLYFRYGGNWHYCVQDA